VWGKTGSKLYGNRSGSDYIDNHKRFTMFCKAAIESVKALPFGPGEDCVFVANDWHSALIPLIIKVGTYACPGGWHAVANPVQLCDCC
jgi:granule-bound starch synthase